MTIDDLEVRDFSFATPVLCSIGVDRRESVAKMFFGFLDGDD